MRGGPSWRAVATNQVEAEEGAGGAERKAFVPPQGFLSPPPPCALAQPTLPSLSWSVERGKMQRCDGTGSISLHLQACIQRPRRAIDKRRA
jgi:hypothetical protein